VLRRCLATPYWVFVPLVRHIDDPHFSTTYCLYGAWPPHHYRAIHPIYAPFLLFRTSFSHLNMVRSTRGRSRATPIVPDLSRSTLPRHTPYSSGVTRARSARRIRAPRAISASARRSGVVPLNIPVAPPRASGGGQASGEQRSRSDRTSSRSTSRAALPEDSSVAPSRSQIAIASSRTRVRPSRYATRSAARTRVQPVARTSRWSGPFSASSDQLYAPAGPHTGPALRPMRLDGADTHVVRTVDQYYDDLDAWTRLARTLLSTVTLPPPVRRPTSMYATPPQYLTDQNMDYIVAYLQRCSDQTYDNAASSAREATRFANAPPPNSYDPDEVVTPDFRAARLDSADGRSPALRRTFTHPSSLQSHRHIAAALAPLDPNVVVPPCQYSPLSPSQTFMLTFMHPDFMTLRIHETSLLTPYSVYVEDNPTFDRLSPESHRAYDISLACYAACLFPNNPRICDLDESVSQFLRAFRIINKRSYRRGKTIVPGLVARCKSLVNRFPMSRMVLRNWDREIPNMPSDRQPGRIIPLHVDIALLRQASVAVASGRDPQAITANPSLGVDVSEPEATSQRAQMVTDDKSPTALPSAEEVAAQITPQRDATAPSEHAGGLPSRAGDALVPAPSGPAGGSPPSNPIIRPPSPETDYLLLDIPIPRKPIAATQSSNTAAVPGAGAGAHSDNSSVC